MEGKLESHEPSLMKTIQLNDGKAGMQGLDKEMINKVIYEASKGTPYFSFQEKRQKSIDSKVNEFKSILSRITEKERSAALAKMGALSASLESERDLSHSIVHIDMDAFYAAVEMEDNPSLKNKPMAVGSSSMLSTSNYEARKYGVRAAMPGFIAKKLCPNLTIVPCNFDKYKRVSNKVRNVVREYDPDFCPASLDEMYLDLTDFIKDKHKKQLHEESCVKNEHSDSRDPLNENGSESYKSCPHCNISITDERRDQMAYDIVNEIRNRICLETNLTASAGIAPNVMLAKVCSDQNKPNGQYQIPSTLDAVLTFISTLAVKKVSGIGPVQGQILSAIGINTCSDMWEKRDIVAALFKSTSADFYMRVARGIGSTTVKSDYVRKSIGVEQTFREICKSDELHKKCQELCDEAVEDLRLHNMLGKVVVLKFKTTEFVSHTRNHSLAFYSADRETISTAAKRLLDVEIAALAPKPLRLRLMGIRLANLVYEGTVPNIEKHLVKIKDFLKAKEPHTTQTLRTVDSHTTNEATSTSCQNELDSATESGTACQLDESANYNISAFPCNNSTESPEIGNARLSYTCPVCRFDQKVETLNDFNSHIDTCLNKTAIKEILADDLVVKKRKQIRNDKQNTKRPKCLDSTEKRIEDYFH